MNKHSKEDLAKVKVVWGIKPEKIVQFLENTSAALGPVSPVYQITASAQPSALYSTSLPGSSRLSGRKRSANEAFDADAFIGSLFSDEEIERAVSKSSLDHSKRQAIKIRKVDDGGKPQRRSSRVKQKEQAEIRKRESSVQCRLRISNRDGVTPRTKKRLDSKRKGKKSSQDRKKDRNPPKRKRERLLSSKENKSGSLSRIDSDGFLDIKPQHSPPDRLVKPKLLSHAEMDDNKPDDFLYVKPTSNPRTKKNSSKSKNRPNSSILPKTSTNNVFTPVHIPLSMPSPPPPRRVKSSAKVGPSTKVFDPCPSAKIIPHVVESPVPQSKSPLSPKTPLEHILDFAHAKNTVLAKLGKQDKSNPIRKRISLSTFVGCEEFSKIGVASYVGTLCTLHADVVYTQVLEGSSKDAALNIDSLFCELSDEQLARDMASGELLASTRGKMRQPTTPPHIERTIDVLQLVFRLWQKMSSGDESVTDAFFDSMYAEDAVKSVSALSIAVLKLWRKRNTLGHEADYARGEIVEWSIRVLGQILSFELSPISRISYSKLVRPPSTLLCVLGEEGECSLAEVLDIILDYVGCENIGGRECRLAASEITQVYLIRHHYHYQNDSPFASLWKKILEAGKGHVESVLRHKTFWPLTVHSAIQTVKKSEHSRDVLVEVAFLVSVLSEPMALRNLFENQAKVRHALLEVFLKLLERIWRDLLGSVTEVEVVRTSYPGLPSVLDLVRKLMSFAIVQREVITSGELGRKGKYLESIEHLISRAAKLVRGSVDTVKFLDTIPRKNFAKVSDELQRALSGHGGGKGASQGGTESESDDPEIMRLKAIARYKALAFAAWLIGSLGKSMEDGSRDMSQMNGLRVLLSSKFNNTRLLRRLWVEIMKIQGTLEYHIPAELCTDHLDSSNILMTDVDRNNFSMVVEGIRAKFDAEGKEKIPRSSSDNSSLQSSPELELRARVKEVSAKLAFPAVTKIRNLRSAVSTAEGYKDLDNDPNLLHLVSKNYQSKGEQVLARYDQDSDLTFKWVRLQKKNAYIGNARELLDKSDRILGNPCSCLPGNPSDRSNGRDRIACANDSCENRLTKVECVPGECGAGSYCQNQQMQRQEYAKTKTVAFANKGVGVVASEDIPAGTFIGEYQGEIISMDEFSERKKKYRGEKHFYFMTLTPKLVIDASRKSQFTRFVNHSCAPNSETQKWNAGGEPRVGIFAFKDIPKGEEITFDYGARSIANGSIPCLCGADTCRGFLTAKKTKEGGSDEVPIDVSGLANAANHVRMNSSHSRNARSEEDVPSSEEDKDLEEKVKEKVKRAKEYLKLAEGLRMRRAEALGAQNVLNESSLDDQTKARLAEWESVVSRKIKGWKLRGPYAKESMLGLPTSLKETSRKTFNDTPSNLDARMRIPRRPQKAIQKPSQNFLKNYMERNLKNDEPMTKSKSIPRHPFPRRSESQKGGSRYRGSTVPLAQGTLGIRGDVSHGISESRPDPTPPRRKLPGFVPVSTKFRRPLPTPKTAKKVKKKRDSDDSDSMDGYSTASSVEPILEEAKDMEAPDGLEACSDDEFVAAPPIEPEPREPEQRDTSGYGRARPQVHDSRYVVNKVAAPRPAEQMHGRFDRNDVNRRRSPRDSKVVPEQQSNRNALKFGPGAGYHGDRTRGATYRSLGGDNTRHHHSRPHFQDKYDVPPQLTLKPSHTDRDTYRNRHESQNLSHDEGPGRAERDSIHGHPYLPEGHNDSHRDSLPGMDRSREFHRGPASGGFRGGRPYSRQVGIDRGKDAYIGPRSGIIKEKDSQPGFRLSMGRDMGMHRGRGKYQGPPPGPGRHRLPERPFNSPERNRIPLARPLPSDRRTIHNNRRASQDEHKLVLGPSGTGQREGRSPLLSDAPRFQLGLKNDSKNCSSVGKLDNEVKHSKFRAGPKLREMAHAGSPSANGFKVSQINGVRYSPSNSRGMEREGKGYDRAAHSSDDDKKLGTENGDALRKNGGLGSGKQGVQHLPKGDGVRSNRDREREQHLVVGIRKDVEIKKPNEDDESKAYEGKSKESKVEALPARKGIRSGDSIQKMQKDCSSRLLDRDGTLHQDENPAGKVERKPTFLQTVRDKSQSEKSDLIEGKEQGAKEDDRETKVGKARDVLSVRGSEVKAPPYVQHAKVELKDKGKGTGTQAMDTDAPKGTMRTEQSSGEGSSLTTSYQKDYLRKEENGNKSLDSSDAGKASKLAVGHVEKNGGNDARSEENGFPAKPDGASRGRLCRPGERNDDKATSTGERGFPGKPDGVLRSQLPGRGEKNANKTGTTEETVRSKPDGMLRSRLSGHEEKIVDKAASTGQIMFPSKGDGALRSRVVHGRKEEIGVEHEMGGSAKKTGQAMHRGKKGSASGVDELTRKTSGGLGGKGLGARDCGSNNMGRIDIGKGHSRKSHSRFRRMDSDGNGNKRRGEAHNRESNKKMKMNEGRIGDGHSPSVLKGTKSGNVGRGAGHDNMGMKDVGGEKGRGVLDRMGIRKNGEKNDNVWTGDGIRNSEGGQARNGWEQNDNLRRSGVGGFGRSRQGGEGGQHRKRGRSEGGRNEERDRKSPRRDDGNGGRLQRSMSGPRRLNSHGNGSGNGERRNDRNDMRNSHGRNGHEGQHGSSSGDGRRGTGNDLRSLIMKKGRGV